jgi:hypothetical protein
MGVEGRKADDVPGAIGNTGPAIAIRLFKPSSALHPAESVVCSTQPAIVG